MDFNFVFCVAFSNDVERIYVAIFHAAITYLHVSCDGIFCYCRVKMLMSSGFQVACVIPMNEQFASRRQLNLISTLGNKASGVEHFS